MENFGILAPGDFNFDLSQKITEMISKWFFASFRTLPFVFLYGDQEPRSWGGRSNAPPPAGGGKSRGPAGRGLKGWSGPKWWWLSAEITNMRWTLMPAGLWGGRQAKLDVKAGKIYVVLYFPAYCYRSSDKNYVKWHLQYRNLFAVKSAVIHRFSLAFHSRSITRSCCPLPLLSCYCSLYTKDGTGHHSEIILDCIIVRYSAVVMDNILCT